MKGRRLGLLPVAVSACALAAVIWWAVHQRRPHIPGSPSAVAWIVLAVVFYAAGAALRGERWWRILRLSHIRANRSEVYALIAVCYMGNNVLPARAGEVLRVYLLSRDTGVGIRKLLGTVLAERILDAFVLGACLLLVVYTLLPAGALPTNQPLLIGGGLLVVLALTVIAARVFGRRALFDRVRNYVRPLADGPRTLLSPSAIPLIGMTMLIWAFEAAAYVTVGLALGIHLSALDAIYLMSLSNFVTALPAAPGSLGTFDAAVIFGLSAISLSANAVSYLLVLRLVLYGPITLAGLSVMLFRYSGLKLLRERRGHTLPSMPVPGPVASEVLPPA